MSVLWVPSPDEGGGSSRLNTNLNLIFNSSKYGICRISSLKLKNHSIRIFPISLDVTYRSKDERFIHETDEKAE